MKTNQHPQYIYPASREEWLNARRDGIGSSEVATIAGLNPYETPLQLWQRRVGLTPPKAETLPMRLGHLLEDAVATLWQDATGHPFNTTSVLDFLVRWPNSPHIQASPDRIFYYTDADGARQQGILECKTTQRAIDPDSVPDGWLCQVQYQLGVAGLRRGAIAWLIGGRDFGYVDVDFNAELFTWLVGLADEFYTVNILGRVPPAPLTAADMQTLYPREAAGKTAEATEEIFQSYEQLKALRARMKQDEAAEAQLADQLKLAIGEAETLSFQGKRLATWKAPKPARRFDAKAFQAAHPALYDEFTVEAPASRRFLLK